MLDHRHLRPLMQPARPRVVLKYLGQLAIALVPLLALPAVVALAVGDTSFAVRMLLGGVLPAALLALAARLPRPAAPIQANEALAVSALGFPLAALLACWPLAGAGLAPLDALFETVSGVTTTGLSCAATVADKGPAFLFTRAWLQWFGGLGMVVLSLALIVGSGGDARRLADPAGEEEDLAAGTRLHARRMLTVYLVLSGAGFALLWLSGLAPFTALLHTLSAVSTGGFSSLDDSLAQWGRPAQFATLLLAFGGALPLVLFHRARRHGTGELLRHVEFRALLGAILITAALVWALSSLGPADALLQALTAQTGTGFSTTTIAALEPGAKWALILSMLSGAGVGSTAGGIKLLRLLVLLRLVQVALVRAQLPRHAVAQPRLNGRPLESEQIQRAVVVLLLFLGVVLSSWLAFLAAGFEPLDGLFEVVSATATVGLSTGISGPELAPWLKGVLIFDMLAGRVEVLALLVVLYPATWLRR